MSKSPKLEIINLRKLMDISCIKGTFVNCPNHYKNKVSLSVTDSCMPSPLAPDPIRVQSCVCFLFWTNRDSMVVTSIFLSISLYN